MRVRAIMGNDPGRFRHVGLTTLEHVLRGYSLKRIRTAWALTPWSAERTEMRC